MAVAVRCPRRTVAVPLLHAICLGTSRVEPHDFPRLHDISAEHNGAVALLWHEEVMTVAYGYDYLGLRGHTLASVGAAGEVITRMLRLCNFVVFRAARPPDAHDGARGAAGDDRLHADYRRRDLRLTVDGSRGPPYRMKTGGIVIAGSAANRSFWRAPGTSACCGCPRGPWPCPCRSMSWLLLARPLHSSGERPDGSRLDAFRLQLENDLIDLAACSTMTWPAAAREPAQTH